MKKFILLLSCLYSVGLYAADGEPKTSSLGSVESQVHKNTDSQVDASYLEQLANMSHTGFYALGFLGLGYHRAKLVDQAYRAYSTQYGALAGYGRMLQNNRYLGAEVVYTWDLFDKRKGNSHFRRGNAYELVARYGKTIQANFLPYMRLGVGYQDYQYFAGTKKTDFHGVLLTPGVGVQAFFGQNLFLRVETNYQFTTSVKNKGVKVNRKPQGPSIWGGVGIVF